MLRIKGAYFRGGGAYFRGGGGGLFSGGGGLLSGFYGIETISYIYIGLNILNKHYIYICLL